MGIPAEAICPTVSRVDISWVCVATNDGHPLHLDHTFAQAAGFKDVVVPGHLLIGWMGQYLADWCGDPRNVLTWKIRFSAPVWPGDKIVLNGAFAEDDTGDPVRSVKVTAVSQEGKTVGVVTAQMRMKAAG
ncbi:MAG: MaoC family dehydratase N-terminal domain-containing protein [Sulfuritalea sp.]|nr:MaoC family dehydratase N-terminal domain-containing protein [Sulfuritalea sp.]